MSELVVFTCASGKQCSHIIPLLQRQSTPYRLRLVVHSASSMARLKELYPDTEVVKANLEDLNDCRRISEGATTIYYVSPTFQPNEAQLGMNVIDAAVSESKKPVSKFSHFIFSSVLHPEISKLPNHDRKRLIEEHLCESSLNYTILQPSHFADNALPRIMAQKASASSTFVAFHNPEIAFSFSCLNDYAEASVKVIQEKSKHYFATYQLVSTMPLKYTDFIQTVGKVIGKTFEVKQIQYEETVEMYCKLVFGADGADTQRLRDGPERLLLYYNSRGIVGNPTVLEWLIGRRGKSPAELAAMMLQQTSGISDETGKEN